jgi:predicted nucleic acid-binding protein
MASGKKRIGEGNQLVARFIDPLYTNNFLDANIFDEVASGKNESVNAILRLLDEEAITILLPYSVQNELANPKTPEAVRRAAQNFNYSVQVQLTGPEVKLHAKLLADLIGDSEPKNIAQDLFHVFEAQKNGGGHFITRDKRLVKRSDLIAELLNIEVLTPEAFVEKVGIAKERKAEFERQRQ